MNQSNKQNLTWLKEQGRKAKKDLNHVKNNAFQNHYFQDSSRKANTVFNNLQDKEIEDSISFITFMDIYDYPHRQFIIAFINYYYINNYQVKNKITLENLIDTVINNCYEEYLYQRKYESKQKVYDIVMESMPELIRVAEVIMPYINKGYKIDEIYRYSNVGHQIVLIRKQTIKEYANQLQF